MVGDIDGDEIRVVANSDVTTSTAVFLNQLVEVGVDVREAWSAPRFPIPTVPHHLITGVGIEKSRLILAVSHLCKHSK